MQEIEQSAGSADAEMGIIEESISFKVNRLQQTFVGFFQDLVDRGLIGDVVDSLTAISTALTGIVTAADGLPGFAAIIASIHSAISGKGGSKCTTSKQKRP